MKVLLTAFALLLVAVPAAAQEQAIHGYVNYVEHAQNRLYITTDDGRPIVVDIGGSPNSPSARNPGEAVMVFGTPTGPTTFRATNVVADRDHGQAATSLPSGWTAVQGRVERVDGSRLMLRTHDNRILTVDMTQVARPVQRAIQQGDTITVLGEAARQTPQLFTARFIQSDRTSSAMAQATGSGQPAGGWQRIHGQVQSVQGTTLLLRADDGRTLAVDMKDVNPAVQRALTPNEGVEVIGHYRSGDQQQVAARWIQQDSSNPARGGRVFGRGDTQPSASPPAASGQAARGDQGKVDEKAWQRIHGKVDSVQGSTLRLKADDGRSITVDMSKVNPAVQKALTQGEGVTVIGHLEKDRTHVNAQFIQQDSSAGAASPRGDQKKK